MGFVGELVERVDEHDRILGVVDRGRAIQERWLHRVAAVVCRDSAGRILVHRRPETDSLFPGHYNWLIGGAVAVGESYRDGAGRELVEELGVLGRTRFLFKFLCHGAIAPYWLGLHETAIDQDVFPDPSEIAWHDWVPESKLRDVMRQWPFVPDSIEAFSRYSVLTGDLRRPTGEVHGEGGR
ncbi:NUDIX domain-containing protein [Nocardia xishanensis]|uniref:NUDIX hydrolase n=1 Tax=Nocardia xishanensis TaxID=238964 RepID=UPI0033CE55EB